MEGAPELDCPIPVPLSRTRTGEPLAVAVSITAALRLPCAAGVNVTLRVQVFAGAIGTPEHVPEMLKSPGLTPLTVILLTVSGAGPLLTMVMLCGALADPCATFPKLRLAGLAVRFGRSSAMTAKLKSSPAAIADTFVNPLTWTGTLLSTLLPLPSSPYSLSPQAQTVPLFSSARLCGPCRNRHYVRQPAHLRRCGSVLPSPNRAVALQRQALTELSSRNRYHPRQSTDLCNGVKSIRIE